MRQFITSGVKVKPGRLPVIQLGCSDITARQVSLNLAKVMKIKTKRNTLIKMKWPIFTAFVKIFKLQNPSLIYEVNRSAIVSNPTRLPKDSLPNLTLSNKQTKS